MKNIISKIKLNEDINWKELFQSEELPEEAIDLILDKEDFSLVELLFEHPHRQFTNRQMRKVIHLVPKEKLKLIEEHHSFLKFVDNSFCVNLEDFKTHTLHHIDNVIDLALDIVDFVKKHSHLAKYFNVEDKSVEELRYFVYKGIQLHDKGKMCDEDEFLKKHNLDTPLYHELYRHYGIGYSDELKKVIDKLNEVDNDIVNAYLMESKASNSMKNFFLRVERLADCVDRGCNLVTSEEMNKPPMMPSKFLEGQISKEEMEIVNYLEKRYKLSYRSSFQ